MVSVLFFQDFIYLFHYFREREREGACKQGEGEEGRERISSRSWAESGAHMGPDLTNPEIVT